MDFISGSHILVPSFFECLVIVFFSSLFFFLKVFIFHFFWWKFFEPWDKDGFLKRELAFVTVRHLSRLLLW